MASADALAEAAAKYEARVAEMRRHQAAVMEEARGSFASAMEAVQARRRARRSVSTAAALKTLPVPWHWKRRASG